MLTTLLINMEKKYVRMAFERNLKGRFDVLAAYYGDSLFHIPASIMCEQIKDELGIVLNEQNLYNLKRRLHPKTGKATPAPSVLIDPSPTSNSPVSTLKLDSLAEALDKLRAKEDPSHRKPSGFSLD
ncbi:hypothetical protein BWI93_13130 [Siphonobacter sp. BAB-5385]|uniref:hypothetical protein n=1 Tax=Siphonobacter sp. BAB-5385 TaxID=1864822 RepID=UPI000B9E8C23|nr:hypothetical protein [Siphonobacter sp. BAB-5385]OZI07704.1 hypothetical protein BWI93_13130 [Siphonobacter sp. BAB-5385]